MRLIAFIALLSLAVAGGARAQTIDMALSQVGDAGNAADPNTGYGAVSYDYAIGTYDVTISQYCTFLNAVALSDPYSLYNPDMTDMGNFSGATGVAGILQSGISGSYSYSIIGNSAQDPVTAVSWLDAARFCNWMQNGQLTTGVEDSTTTENGAYSLLGDTSFGLETRNSTATWWLPSADEWYKAAFYDPTLQSGSGGYWLYATRSNDAPVNAMGSGTNSANYYTDSGYAVTQDPNYSDSQNYLTPVGSYTRSASYYGTYDQNGDVNQWVEDAQNGQGTIWGGSWFDDPSFAQSSFAQDATSDAQDLGFRVATTAVPEPGTALLIPPAIGLLAWAGRKRARKTRS